MARQKPTTMDVLDGPRTRRIRRMLRLAEAQPGELAQVMCFTIADVADLLAVSPRTARRYIADGHLQPVGIEGSPRVTLLELIRFTEESPLARKVK